MNILVPPISSKRFCISVRVTRFLFVLLPDLQEMIRPKCIFLVNEQDNIDTNFSQSMG